MRRCFDLRAACAACVTLMQMALSASEGSCAISDYGAKADGSLCAQAQAFADAMEAAAVAGGGRVVVPKGRWFTGSIHLRSNCELHLDDGAEVVFSDDPAEYRRPDGGYRPLFSAENLAHARISGNFGRLEAFS